MLTFGWLNVANMCYGANFHQKRFIKIGHTVAKVWRFNAFFQNGGRPSSWICWAHIVTTHDDYLVVSITVQNLAGTDAVFSII